MRSRFLPVFVLFSGLVACEAESPIVPPDDAPRLAATTASHSAIEQELMDAARNGEDMGAILDREVPCGQLVGFSNNGAPVAFGGLFPTEGPQGICPLSNFQRTNQDGSVDLHLQGTGSMFLFVFNPPGSFGSAGSFVRWRILEHAGGVSIFTVSGRLGDGSRVRAHFVTDPDGGLRPANTLWVEGMGYLVGGPPGRQK